MISANQRAVDKNTNQPLFLLCTQERLFEKERLQPREDFAGQRSIPGSACFLSDKEIFGMGTYWSGKE